MLRPLTRLPDCPYDNPPGDFGELIEIRDDHASTLMLMPVTDIQKSALSRRVILLCLKNTRKEIFLRRRAKHLSVQPDLWDISVSGHVLAGEALEDAALRGLEQDLGLGGVRIQAMASLPYRDNAGASLLASYFLAGPTRARPRPNPEKSSDGMFLSEEELRGLMEHEPDMFSSELRWGVRSGWMFGPRVASVDQRDQRGQRDQRLIPSAGVPWV